MKTCLSKLTVKTPVTLKVVVLLVVLLAACTNMSNQATADAKPDVQRTQPGLDIPDTAFGPIAYVGVNVITMRDESVQANQSVVVQDGLITEVGNTADVEIPSDATILRPEEGNPWYLMPGLADMHTHESFFRRTQDEQNNFLLYLINGVTTILNMGDFSGEAPATSQAVLDGQFDGPTMYTAHFAQGTQTYSFITALSPERGRQLVRDAKRAGYDFIKLHGGIKTDVFDAIMDEATAQNMAVIGHGERGPGMEYILDHGMSMVAHTEEFIYTSFQFKTDTSKIPAVTDIVRRNDVFVTATLSAYETIAE